MTPEDGAEGVRLVGGLGRSGLLGGLDGVRLSVEGEVVTLTYTVAIDDHDGGVTPQTFVVTIKGTNDAPVIDAITQQDLTEQTDTAPLTTTIPVTFTDVDLTDIGHTAAITHAVASGVTTGLALDEAGLIALIDAGGGD